jgi:hypothetical protein
MRMMMMMRRMVLTAAARMIACERGYREGN